MACYCTCEASQWVPSTPADSGTGLCPPNPCGAAQRDSACPRLLQIALVLAGSGMGMAAARLRGGKLSGVLLLALAPCLGWCQSGLRHLLQCCLTREGLQPACLGLGPRRSWAQGDGSLGSAGWSPLSPAASDAAPKAAERQCAGTPGPACWQGRAWLVVAGYARAWGGLLLHCSQCHELAHGSNSPPSPPLWISRST